MYPASAACNVIICNLVLAPIMNTVPFARFEWMLAGRYLRARRREGFISIIAIFSFLGIMLGVATLIIVMAVMNGFHNELLGKVLGTNGHVVINPVRSAPLRDYDAIAKKLGAIDGVVHIMPLVEGQVMFSTPAKATGGLVRGVREAELQGLVAISDNVRFGTIEGFDQNNGVAIGTRLANELGIKLGGLVSLVSPRGSQTPFGTAPRVRTYKVVAIFEIGMSTYDAGMMFMPLPLAQLFLNKSGTADAIEIMVNDPDNVASYLADISAAAGPNTSVGDWRQRNASFFSALQVEANVQFLVLSLIVLVAALNIISGMIMLVKDKTRDIAVLRTMGASRGAMMRVFFITGSSIGIAGTVAGTLLGVLVCENIESVRQFISWLTNTELFSPELYYLSKMPADMDVGEVIKIVGMAMGLSVLATIYPSWRASRLDPVEALRYE
jgi:lipoprotein-releasing system permease protein